MTSQTALVSIDPTPLLWQMKRRQYVGILLQPVFVVATAMAVVYTGRPLLACQIVFLLVMAVFGYHGLRGNYQGATVVLIGAINTLMLMRVHFLYSLPVFLLLSAVGLWIICHRGTLTVIARHRQLVALILISVCYWWVSFLNTGDYSANMRVLELCCTVCLVVLLGTRREMLGVTLTAMALCALVTAVAMAPYGERLGMVVIANVHMGNPIQLGLVTALAVILSIADNGRWLFLPGPRLLGIAFAGAAAVCLARTTSRGSWLVTAAGLSVMFLFSRRDRRRVVGMVGLGVIVIGIAIAIGATGGMEKYFLKVAGDNRTMAERTTRRSDQWLLLPEVFSDSPVFGHGPGTGKYVYERYSGLRLDWHSLYLHVAVETGLVGLTLLAALLGSLLARTWRHYKMYGELLPLTALICFLVIGISVSGFDALSGVYLGLACVSLNRQTLRFTAPTLSSAIEAQPAVAAV